MRHATEADAAAVCDIYNQGIEDRIATLETELRTPEERRRWLAVRGPRHPVIVVEASGQVIGWGSLNEFNTAAGIQVRGGLLSLVDGRWVDVMIMEKLL